MSRVSAHAAPFVHETVCSIMMNLAKKRGRRRVLDAGAGEGALGQHLRKIGFEVYACDIRPENFNVKGMHFRKADLNFRLPYTDRFFDFVVCLEVIEHLENPWGFLSELSRILRPEGLLILTTPNILNIASRLSFLIRGRFSGFLDRDIAISGHITPIPLWLLKRMLEKNDFSIKGLYFNRSVVLSALFSTGIKNPLLGEILMILAEKGGQPRM